VTKPAIREYFLSRRTSWNVRHGVEKTKMTPHRSWVIAHMQQVGAQGARNTRYVQKVSFVFYFYRVSAVIVIMVISGYFVDSLEKIIKPFPG